MTLYPWQRFTTWLGVPGNRRRFAIGAISVSAVIVAVLFFSQLDFLLRLFGSKAEVTGPQVIFNGTDWAGGTHTGTKVDGNNLTIKLP